MNAELKTIIDDFDNLGNLFVKGKRNTIKTFQYQGNIINIKSFRIPVLINGLIYRFLRKSKAKRSYENALILLEKGIGTPKPIAFYEEFKYFFLRKSFYVCEHFEPDLIFRDVFGNEDKYELEKILRGIATFTFSLHEKGIEFIDHSSGNTLIKKDENGNYNFFLVDLNRMKFHEKMSLKKRVFNLRKLAPSQYFIEVICNEYAKLYNCSEKTLFNLVWDENQKFQRKFQRKQTFKQKLFYKK
jgi:hypothetical protein